MNYTLTAARGLFAVAGIAAALSSGARQTTDYVVNGRDARLLVGWKISAATGTFTASGQDATLARAGVSDTGAFSLVGNAVGLLAARSLVADTRAHVFTGNEATLRPTRRLSPAAPGAFSVAGQDAVFEEGYVLFAGSGAVVVASPGAWFAPPFFSGATAEILVGGNDAELLYHQSTRIYRRAALEWPEAVLGCPLRAGYSQQVAPMFERTSISEAPPAFFRFKQDESRLVRVEFLWTLAQFAAFEDFVDVDLNGGMRAFNMRHIADGQLRSLWTRIAGPYTFAPQPDSLTLYRVTFDVQVFWRVARAVDWS